MRVAINEAGIAGTALAYWLHRSGYEVVLIEKAPKFRIGGFGVDFWAWDTRLRNGWAFWRRCARTDTRFGN